MTATSPTSNNFVECVSGQVAAPFIVCGDLLAHEAIYWLGYYAARYPGSDFRVGQAGTSICKHGVPARGFCHHCDGDGHGETVMDIARTTPA